MYLRKKINNPTAHTKNGIFLLCFRYVRSYLFTFVMLMVEIVGKYIVL